jgi:membrane protease YdiL (CAAX protease family)
VHPKRIRQAKACALAAALVAWSGSRPRISSRAQTLANALVGVGLVAVTRAPVGLRPPALWPGLRLGSIAAMSAAGGVAVSTALRPVRVAMAERELPEPAWNWLLARIPLGTVWSEEAAFRAALGTVAADAFGPAGGRLLQSLAFGLSHIAGAARPATSNPGAVRPATSNPGAARPATSNPGARSTGEPVIPTVLLTGAAGWLFGWLRDRSGSLAAPMLAHLAVNEAGAVAALAVQRRPSPRRRPLPR